MGAAGTSPRGGGDTGSLRKPNTGTMLEWRGVESESAEVVVGTTIHVRNIGLSSESEREPFNRFREYIKISQFYIGHSGSHSRDKECLLS